VLDPLHDYAVVHALPDVMQRIASSNPDLPMPAAGANHPSQQTGRIILPDTTAFDGMSADGGTGTTGGRGGAVTTLLVGRVLWVGAGKHREGMFIEPTIRRGDMVLFMPRTVSYEFRLHGRTIKIVPYHELVSSVREVPADDPAWLHFVELTRAAMQLPAAEAV